MISVQELARLIVEWSKEGDSFTRAALGDALEEMGYQREAELFRKDVIIRKTEEVTVQMNLADIPRKAEKRFTSTGHRSKMSGIGRLLFRSIMVWRTKETKVSAS